MHFRVLDQTFKAKLNAIILPPPTPLHPTHTKASTLPPFHTHMRVHRSQVRIHSGFSEWGWEAVTVSVDVAPYQTIRLPSDSLSRWRWDSASEARTPADTESMEASPDLLPDGGALMWARVSLVSPVWSGLRWCQDAGRSGLLRPSFWLAATAPLRSLAPGQGVVIRHKLTKGPHTIFIVKTSWVVGCIHSTHRPDFDTHAAGRQQSSRHPSQ